MRPEDIDIFVNDDIKITENEYTYQSMNLAGIESLINDHNEVVNWDEAIELYVRTLDNKESFAATQQDIDASFVRIPTPKGNHNSHLVPIVLVGVFSINGVCTT